MKNLTFSILIIVFCVLFLLWNMFHSKIGHFNEPFTYEYKTDEDSNFCSDHKNTSNKGVYYDDATNQYYITLGLKNTGGYGIDVKTIHIDKKGNVSIVVKEESPGPNDMVTMAFTCPTIEISFSEEPNSITVVNTLGEEFH